MQQPSPRTNPSVGRAEFDGENYSAEHKAELSRIVEDPIRIEMKRQARIAELTRRAYEPLLRLIQEDADAMSAHTALSKEFPAARVDPLSSAVLTFEHPTTFALSGVHLGTNVFSRPFDYEIDGPSSSSARITTDRVAGTHEFHLPRGHGGGRYATAGIGVTLRADVTGVAHIRPSWRYDFHYYAGSSFGVTAYTEGSAIAVVQDANTGAGLANRQVWLWNVESGGSTGIGGGDSGYIDSWALALDVLVHEGQLFNVSLMASGYVDDSQFLVASSSAEGFLSMSVPLIAIEL